jgi:Uma2 family endonuclease
MVTRTIALGPELDWLPDDTEESLLGTSIHQAVIVILDTCLNYFRRRAGLPWFVGNQLKLIIPRQGDREAYRPSPDIIVHANLTATELTSLNVQVYGPPALVIEVASPSTAQSHDLDTLNPAAKPSAYAQAGIPEYLVFDPIGDIIPEQVRAWRMGPEGSYIPWLPDPATGRWHSALGVSFASHGLRLRVYDPNGNLIPTTDEIAMQRDAMGDQLETMSNRMEAMSERLEAQAREIAALRAALQQRDGN